MNQSQKQTRTCGNCKSSEEAPQTSWNNVRDPKQVKCNIDGRNHYFDEEACCEWKAKENA